MQPKTRDWMPKVVASQMVVSFDSKLFADKSAFGL